MDFNSLVSWVVAQPWAFAVPFVTAVIVDWGVGVAVAMKDKTFNKNRLFDWVQTTVGWKKGVAVIGSVTLAYFLKGQHDAYLALVPLVAVNGAAFLVVIDDIRVKVFDLLAGAPIKLS